MVRVEWSAEDGEYVATCDEFPSLSWLAATQDEAIRGLESVTPDHICDSGDFDRTLCACDWMHSYCTVCGERQDDCESERG